MNKRYTEIRPKISLTIIQLMIIYTSCRAAKTLEKQ